jgi:hypothetical protein
MRAVVSNLLRQMMVSVQGVPHAQRWASLALHVLPGVMRTLSLTRNPTPIGLLRAACEENGSFAVMRILRVAASH